MNPNLVNMIDKDGGVTIRSSDFEVLARVEEAIGQPDGAGPDYVRYDGLSREEAATLLDLNG